MTSTSETPAGWHPDPTGQFEQRYWDGSKWTEHVHAAGVQSVSPLPTGPAPAEQAQAQQPAEPSMFDLDAIPGESGGFGSAQASTIQVEPTESAPIGGEPIGLQPEPIRLQPDAASAHAAAHEAAMLQQAAEHNAAQAGHGVEVAHVAQPAALAAQPAAAGPPAGWHADPAGQFEQRYWDGSQWTEHVAHQGQQGVSPLSAPQQVHTSSAAQVQRQVQHQAGLTPTHGGGGHLMDEPILVVNQKAKIIEVTQEFAVYDQAGNQLGSVVEVGQNAFRKLVRILTRWDQFMTHKFEVRDQTGTVLLTLVRPAKLMKSRVIVGAATGQEIGVIRQENVMGKIRFAFEVSGQRIGGIKAENWRAWNFSVVDANDQEVARITKTWEGMLKAALTTADNYVVQIHHRLPEPLRSLVVASALTVDTALKQDSK